MAVQLFLNETEVIIDSTQEIKITKENPYFTLSDSYTLDVSIPLSILQNRKFFGNLQRIDTSKAYTEYSCRLLCANEQILEGTAHIVQSTDQLVKVQLACGVSALKMSSEQEGTYIDKLVSEKEGYNNRYLHHLYLDWGSMPGDNHTGFGVPLLDDTNGKMVNFGYHNSASMKEIYVSECPKLIDIAQLIADRLGYTLDLSCLPEACGSIYVISATQGSIGKKLPHWTVKEFFAQFQNFFGCAFVRIGNKQLKLVSLSEYINRPEVSIEPISDFQVEYSEDDNAEGIMNRNVEFLMESADTEIVDGDVLDQAQYTAEFSDIGQMENGFRDDSVDIKLRKIYKVNGELYIGWVDDSRNYSLQRIAPFNPLVRFKGAESVQLKIAPAFMQENFECEVYNGNFYDDRPAIVLLNVPSVSNHCGLSDFWKTAAMGGSSETPTLQGLIEGTETTVKGDEKADVISVAFIDGNEETVTVSGGEYENESTYKVHLAFTDYNFKRQLSNNRSKWSFSLKPLDGYDFYLGQLHEITFNCSHKVKHIIKFVSPTIPDPSSIFIIHGKRFACQKIEASIRDGQLDRLMTGYFYEFLQVAVPVT